MVEERRAEKVQSRAPNIRYYNFQKKNTGNKMETLKK